MSDAMNVHEFPAGGDNADGPVHFSPPRGTLVVCLGPSTAAAAERIGLDVAAVATEQTPTGLVAALVAALAAPPPTTTEVTP